MLTSGSYHPARLYKEVKATCLKRYNDKEEAYNQVPRSYFNNTTSDNDFDIYTENEADGFIYLEYKTYTSDNQNDFESDLVTPEMIEGSSYYSFNESGYYSGSEYSMETQSNPPSSLFDETSDIDSELCTEKEADGFISTTLRSSKPITQTPIYREDSGYFSCTKEPQSLDKDPCSFIERYSQIKRLQVSNELNAMKKRHIERYPFEAAILDYFADDPEWLMEYLTLDFSFYMV
jgi:hypothetical protein